MTTNEILAERRGVCRQYVKIFGDMCQVAGIRVKSLKGFAKGYDYEPGKARTVARDRSGSDGLYLFRSAQGDDFVPGESAVHAWNAVFVYGVWRLLDTTWGAGRIERDGTFLKELNEHFFLTDPDEFIYTHFPYDEVRCNSLSEYINHSTYVHGYCQAS